MALLPTSSRTIVAERAGRWVRPRRGSAWASAEYRELEAGERWPNWETFDWICTTFGWPQTFASPS